MTYIQDVLPAGSYALVRSDRVRPAPLATSTDVNDYIAIAQAAGLKGLAFQVGDSRNAAINWAPDASSPNDWQRVQALLAQPGFIAALGAAGLKAVGYSYLGPYGRVNTHGEAMMAQYLQTLGAAGYVFDVTDPDWNNDTTVKGAPCNGCYAHGVQHLARHAEALTKSTYPIFLLAPALATARPSDPNGHNYWWNVNSDATLLRTLVVPKLVHAAMDTVAYKASYDSYQVGLQGQLFPLLDYCLDLHGTDGAEVTDAITAFGSNNGPTGPNIGGGITLASGQTPTVGFVLLDDLEEMGIRPELGASVMAATQSPVYWDGDLSDGTSFTLVRFQIYSPSWPDPWPQPVVGQPFSVTIGIDSMKLNFFPNVLIYSYIAGTGLNDTPTGFTVNGNPAFHASVVGSGGQIVIAGTFTDTRPVLLRVEVDTNLFSLGATRNFWIPLVPASASSGGPNAGLVAGGSAFIQAGLSRAAGERSPFPPVVTGQGSISSSYPSWATYSPPWFSPVPGTSVITPGEGAGSGVYSEGPTTCFAKSINGVCSPGYTCVDNDLLNLVFSMLSTQLPDFNLDFWALAIALISHESGWVTNIAGGDCKSTSEPDGTPIGSQGLWQIEIFAGPGVLPCPVVCPAPVPADFMAANPDSEWTTLADPATNTQRAIALIVERDLIAKVNAAVGGWGNTGAIAEIIGPTWHTLEAGEPALETYLCIRDAVKAATWPIATSGGSAMPGCPTHAPITCNYDNGSRPTPCSPTGTYPGHTGTDFSDVGGSTFSIDHADPDPHNWTYATTGPASQPILSPVKGTVLFAGLDPNSDFNHDGPGLGQLGDYGHGLGYGYYVDVEEETQLRKVRMAHFDDPSFLLVATGQAVQVGQPVSRGMGARGQASGTHLHLEVFTRATVSDAYTRVDPVTVLPAGCP